jgi:SNF2 family DNA or RNA helicase
LQQITCGFWRREGKLIEIPSWRCDTLIETIEEIAPDEKIIIFAKFHYDITQIKARLEGKYGPGCVAIFTGQLDVKTREKELERFRNGARFFLATQNCGGHGLTLNEAHYVIFYNNCFKYAERLQAEDRCHRIGQEHKVTYIDISCAFSIDDRIERALSKKGSVVRDFKREVDKVKSRKTKAKDLFKAL